MNHAGTETLRVATLSKADSTGGGASRVAEQLSDAYRAMGMEAAHYCVHPKKGTGDGRRKLYGSVIRHGHTVARRLGLAESLPLEAPSVLSRISPAEWDVLHVHDTTTALSPVTLELLARRIPTVWTFHDASPFTGGCIQPMDCTRFRVGCGKCPQSGTWPLNGPVDATRLHAYLRRRVHAGGRVATVSPSHWLADLAMSGGALSERPRVIPNPIRTDEYRPAKDRRALRRSRGIPEDRLVLVISAGHVSDPRKGVAHALKTVHALARLSPYVILVGGADPSLGPLLQGIDFVATGYVSDSVELAGWYACADAFVYCASIDNQPLTVLETQACGVPTFGFAVGGTPELVERGVNGTLVPHGDVSSLADALEDAATSGALEAMGRSGRDFVQAGFSLDVVAGLNLDLYRSILEPRRTQGLDA